MSITFAFLPQPQPGFAGARPFFFDPTTTRRALSAAEDIGFDSIVVDDAAGVIGNLELSKEILASCHSLRVFTSHWAGVMEAAVAARDLAALATRFQGRLGVRFLPTGGDPANDGSRVSHAESWRQTNEYIDRIKDVWAETFGSLPGRGSMKSVAIRLGGQSGTALHVAGRHADVFELAPGTVHEVETLIDRVKTAAAHYRRENHMRFALPIRIRQGAGGHELPGGLDALMEKVESYADLGITEFMVIGVESFEALQPSLGERQPRRWDSAPPLRLVQTSGRN